MSSPNTDADADAASSSSNHHDSGSSNAAASSQSLADTRIASPPVLAALPSTLPTTITRSYKLMGNIPTDAYVQIFSDRIVVGVSQLTEGGSSKIGTWCLCQATQSAIDPKAIEFDISTVLGDRNDAMVGVYARQITERIIRQRLMIGGGGGNTTAMVVLLGISLRQPQAKDPEMFQTVIEVLLQLIKDALAQMHQ